MATAAQISANQANAQLSTGPRTPEGKAHVAANSRKEGLLAQTLVIPEDQRSAFESFRDALCQDTRPEGAFEDEFFQRLLTYGWNLRRARLLESTLLAETDPIHDDQSSAKLQRFTRYRRDLERSYDRALAQLRHLQTQRAVLLQQDARVVEAVTNSTPVADLTRITNLTDTYLCHFNPLSYREPPFFASRQAAHQQHQADQAARQNKPNRPLNHIVEDVLRSPTVLEKHKRETLDLLFRAPEPLRDLIADPAFPSGAPAE